MVQVMQTQTPGVPAEVIAFAVEQGVHNYLAAVLEMTRRVFPDAPLSMVVEEDPEIANDRHIVLQVEVRLNVKEALAAQRRWNDGLFACCPAPLVCTFRLGMELVEG